MNRTRLLTIFAAITALLVLNAIRIEFVYNTNVGRDILATAWEFSTKHYTPLEVLGIALASIGVITAVKVFRTPRHKQSMGWNNFGMACLLFGKAVLVWGVLGMITARDMNLIR